jgi:hypothetical protein
MNPWFISGSLIAIILAAGAGYFQGSEHGQASVQAMWDKEKAAQYAEYAKAQEEARKKEQELQANADQLRQEKDREIRNLNARAAALNNSLQHRPTRTSEAGSLSDPSKSCSGASGKELARGDAEFLVWYATEAARLQADLNQCVRQYEALRK